MNNQYVWMVECNSAQGGWTPICAEVSRDKARALQREMKKEKVISVPSRLRRYEANNTTRG